jgi:hypothetical protein
LAHPEAKASSGTGYFGVNEGGQFGEELIVTGKRGSWPPYFDRRFK